MKKAKESKKDLQVLRLRDDDGFRGILQNNPVVIPNLEFGAVIRFQAKHVLDVELAY